MIKSILTLILILLFSQRLYSEILTGKVISEENKSAVSNAKIYIEETKETINSDKDGVFKINLPELSVIHITVSSLKFQTKKYTLTSGEFKSQNMVFTLSPKVYLFNDVVIYSASRQQQKITESPAAVYYQTPEEISTRSRTGQIAQVFQNYSGIDVLQSGASDFIVNTRGFNGGLNRRILVLQDGRETSMPLLGAQEWNSFSMPLEEFSRIEFVRGPAASLYGANAFNGVLNLTSYSPKEVPGPNASILFGDFKTMKIDTRFAGILDKFSYKVTVGHSERLNWANSRTDSSQLEYAGLPLEKKKINYDDRLTNANYGTLRMDYDFTENTSMTAEAGYSRNTNEMFVFGLGRTFVKDVERPYVRLAFNTTDFHLQAHFMQRKVLDTMWLMVPGAPLLDNSKDLFFEAQYNFSLNQDIKFVLGASQDFQQIRTSGTSIPNDVDASYTGIYGQMEYKILNNLDFVTSARFDAASIHASQFSPRFAFVWNPIVNQKLRISAGRSFQRPNYSELYRVTPDAPAFDTKIGKPVNFAALQKRVNDTLAALTGTNPNLNFGLSALNAKAIGNKDLVVEKNLGFEFGYEGIFFDRLQFTTDIYFNQLSDFITNFLPGVNPSIPEWNPTLPENLKQYESMVKEMLTSTLSARDKARLSDYNGIPTFVVSNTNVGKVNQWGVEMNLAYYLNKEIHLDFGYSNYNFEIVKADPKQQVLPNTSPNKFKIGVSYMEPEFLDISVNFNYTEGYNWLAGTYVGYVPDYGVLNLTAGYYILKNLEFSLNVYNLLDRKHYEIFGGTYIPRYSTFRVSFKV